MQFLFPSFLWALMALAIPIIIHLFHFRRFKKVYFTNVHLLKEIKEETSARSKLRNFLILAMRMLALSMFIMAFAQPILRKDEPSSSQNSLVTVFVDNSFSMSANKDEVSLLQLAKDRAYAIIASYSQADRYLVLTHDLSSKHQRIVDQSTALNFVDEIKSTPEVHTLEEILNVADRISSNSTGFNRHHYLLSDFQSSISDVGAPRDSSIEINLLPIRSVRERNVALEDCFFEAPVILPDQTNRVIVRLANYGEQESEVQMTLLYQEQERPQGVVTLEPNSTKFDTITLPVSGTGWHQFQIRIDDYPVQFDDELFASFQIKDRVQILNIFENQSNNYLASAIESMTYYDLRQVSRQSVRYDEFGDFELIILDDLVDLSSGLVAELSGFVEAGGNLLVFPSARANLDAYNQLMDRLDTDRFASLQNEEFEVSNLNSENFLFNDVFINSGKQIRLPRTSLHYKIMDLQARSSIHILEYRNGDPFLFNHSFGKGNTYVVTSPLSTEYNDLVRNAEVFVPMIYKMALSSGSHQSLYYTIGRDNMISFDHVLSPNDGNYVMSGKTEFIPGINIINRQTLLEVSDQIEESGFYVLRRDDSVIGTFAFNYDRTESDVRLSDMDDLARSMGESVKIISEVDATNLAGFIQEKHEGILLWRWCIVFGLIFLLAESLLLRLWK